MRAHTITAIAALTLGAAAAATPAAAQYAYDTYAGGYVDEVVVPGAHRYRGERPATLSRVVSYRDLNLATYEGQRVLKMRIRETARGICRDLGEGRGAGPLVRSCEDEAVRSARGQMRFAVARAQARSYYASLY